MKSRSVKARKNDIVLHNSREWKVMERCYDKFAEQSYYHLRSGNGRGKPADHKWVRSDAFATV